jgi:energy-coupling factor transporter transmembrane protein EcfT
MPELPSVTATGQLTTQDLYRFSLMTLFSRLWWFFGIMIFVGAWFIVSLVTGSIRWQWSVPNVIGPLFPFVIFPYAFFIAPYFAARKLVETSPNLKGSVHYTFADDGIEFSGPNVQAHLDWKAIVKARETSAQFLFYPQASTAHVIPKRFLPTPADALALRALIRAHVAESKLG